MKPYDVLDGLPWDGFYSDKHYYKVEEVGGADVCVLYDTRTECSSLASVEDLDVHFFVRKVRFDGGSLAKDVKQRCDELHKNTITHDNMAAFLGVIVEQHISPVAKIFEEYAEGELIIIVCTIVQYGEIQFT